MPLKSISHSTYCSTIKDIPEGSWQLLFDQDGTNPKYYSKFINILICDSQHDVYHMTEAVQAVEVITLVGGIMGVVSLYVRFETYTDEYAM